MPINKAITFDDAGYVGFSPEDTPDPSFLDTLGAAVRQENTVGSTIANPRLDYEVRKLNAIDPVYDPFKDLKGYEDQAHLFEEVYNETAATALKRKIDQERKDRATLAQSGWTGTALTFGAGVIDLPTLLPGGALVRGGRIGYNALKSAAAVGAAAGLSTAVQEGVLQGNQELRTPEESAFAIGGSVILGGILGAGASKLFTKGEWNRVAASLEDDLTGEVANPEAVVDQIVKRAQSAGAASVDEFAPTLEEMGVGGPRAAQIVANATAAARISPGVRTMLSPSAKVREIYLKMVDNPIHTAMGMEGKTFGADVENLVKIYNRGAYGQWKRLADQEYINYRKTFGQNAITARLPATGEMMTKSQFMEAVARAGRRNDIDVNGNEFVTKTAQAARERVFDPLLKRAIDAKLLPEDVKTTTAASYVSRLWNRSRLIGEEDRFRQIAGQYIGGAVEQQVQKLTSAKDARIAKLNSVISDLELPAADRAELLRTLPEQLKGIQDANPTFKTTDEQLSQLRSQLFAARKEAKKAEVERLTKEINEKATAAGQDYADYVTTRNLIQSRVARIRNNIAGKAGEIEMLKSRIADIEAANVERLRRLHRSLVILDEDVVKQSPEVWAEQLSKARTQFAQVLERSNKAQDRLAKTRERLAEDPAKLDQAEMKFDAVEAKRLEEAATRADQIADLEKIDPEEAVAELKALVESRLNHAADLVKRESGRIYRLAKRIGESDPKLVKGKVDSLKQKIKDVERDYSDRVDIGMGGQNGFKDYIDEVVSEVFNNLTGKGKGDIPEWIVPIKKGPMKERTFDIPDEMVEDFLENDMEMILRRYSRAMAADVELTQKFGRADMQDQFAEITRDYQALREQAKTPAERLKLDKAEEKDVKHLTAFRDMLRGTYQAADRSSGWSAITNAALTWNYMRLLGGVTLSSLTDASRVPAVHGMTATMREALPILTSRVNGIRSIKIAKRDARELGAVAETVMQSRLASMADLRDPYRYGNRYERFLDNAANTFTKLTGIGWWTDTMNMISSVMTENRVLKNALNWNGMDKYEKAYMGFLGIDEDMAQRIAAQFKKHGMEDAGIKAANVSEWDDDLAYRALGAALNKDTDRTIIKPGMGDIPLWMRTNTGRIVTQFKSFGLASHQRVLIAGLQERPRRLAEAMVFGTAIGMMVSYLKMIERGDYEKAQNLLENPGKWIGDGFDRTGILFLPFEITNTADKVSASMGGANLSIPSVLSRIAGDKDHSGSVTRYASRDPLGAVLGPTAGLFSDLATIAAAMTKGERTKAATNAALRQIPGGSLPGVRTILNAGVKPALQ